MTRASLTLAALLVTVGGVHAQTVLDDTLSPRSQVHVTPRWTYQVARGGTNSAALNSLVAHVDGLEVRLDTSAWIGKRVQIFMQLPLDMIGLRAPGAMRVDWTTRGTLLGGSARPGERSLVFKGKITGKELVDTLDLVIHIDARYMDSPIRIQPRFEIQADAR